MTTVYKTVKYPGKVDLLLYTSCEDSLYYVVTLFRKTVCNPTSTGLSFGGVEVSCSF
jgi:hypothetical protein